MSSSSYNSYNYPEHQESSAQQHPSYRTAPTTNPSAPSSRQSQQSAFAPTNQPPEYLPYSGSSYGRSNSGHGAAQDNTWRSSGNNYGTSMDKGNRAAAILQNMSSASYAASTTAPSQPAFTATEAAPRYPSGRSPQMQAQLPHIQSYGQTQARPRSVNTSQPQAPVNRGLSSPVTAAGYSSQQVQPQYNQQQAQHGPASPAQTQSDQTSATGARDNAPMAAASASQQYADYRRQQHSDLETAQYDIVRKAPEPYAARSSAPMIQAPASHAVNPDPGPSTTVDPTAVYDPWPEYQRQQATRDAERAEKERREVEARKENERLEQEAREHEEAQEAARQAEAAVNQPKARAKQAPNQVTMHVAPPAAVLESSVGGSELEAEIRTMMAKMRELNSKDPQLLARIWEEERRSKAPNKSPTVTTTVTAPQTAVVPPAQVPTPPIANQRKRAIPRESLNTPATEVTTPVQASAVPAKAQAATSMRTGGNTIWPPEKKLELAKAAVHYISTQNPDRTVDVKQILQRLDGNPSYVELCEQLEQIGFKLDRSIFAKSLLLAVPDVNSASRKSSLQPNVFPGTAVKAPAPPAIMRHPAPAASLTHAGTISRVVQSPHYPPAALSSVNRLSNPLPLSHSGMVALPPVPVAEMIPLKPELKPPANKEEAARKRNFSDLIDLTQLDDEDDVLPSKRRLSPDLRSGGPSPYTHIDGGVKFDAAQHNNFPSASILVPVMSEATSRTMSMPASHLRHKAIVEPLDKKKALRRNTYNPATIARDVLLACGRHPTERQLNQHLDALKLHLPQISNDSDLSTIKWSIIDPGVPPPGYFKNGVQVLTDNADDEHDSEAEESNKAARWGTGSHATSGGSAEVQALPEATNPFTKVKRRGRPPRHSLPNTTVNSTPNQRATSLDMSASAPRSSGAAAVGYAAFRSATEFGPDGNPLPKKKGRPVGWRKAIHGSAAAQQRTEMNDRTGKHGSQKPSTLHNVASGVEPIRIDSRSPSSAARGLQYQPFKCKWQGCTAELHNLETLKKHVFKVHQKETLHDKLECLWDNCGKEVASFDAMTNMTIERHTPHVFDTEHAWLEHIQQTHFSPLAWERGDGPAGGLSDAHDSEAYLSDAQGRRVTPRITANPAVLDSSTISSQVLASAPRGRGRPPKNVQEQEARDTQDRLVSLKRRMGGPGMDRGGATLVNDKRRRGLMDGDETEEELVDAEI